MDISEVFTPRSARVNDKTYIPRLSLERALIRSINGSMHSLLFGESGNGKSWLYKKVMAQYGIHYKIANCANASRMGGLTNEIVNSLTPSGSSRKISYSETKEAGISAVFANGKIEHEGQYEVQQTEPLLAAMQRFRRDIGTGDAVLVIDNLESIFNSDQLMSELADIVILLDDERYAETKIKLLIVGVPNGVLEYFGRTKNLESVSNRIEELPKVSGMNLPMVKTLIKKGFNDLLKVSLTEEAINEISQHIHHCTLGVAQRVQEYCEKLAHKLDDHRNVYSSELLEHTDLDWLKIGLRQSYTVVEAHMNSKQTSVARRNQVIYCIGRCNSHQLDATKIAEKIREEFPETSNSSTMGVGPILNELATKDPKLLSKNPNTKDYRIADPRYLMCIRMMLRKNGDGKIYKLTFSQ